MFAVTIMDESSSNSEEDITAQESKCARFVTEYETLTSISMFLSSYFGGLLLKYFTVRQMFAITAVFPMVTILAGCIV